MGSVRETGSVLSVIGGRNIVVDRVHLLVERDIQEEKEGSREGHSRDQYLAWCLMSPNFATPFVTFTDPNAGADQRRRMPNGRLSRQSFTVL